MLVGRRPPNKAPICRYVSPSLRRACAASRDSAAACALAFFCYFALPEHFCYVLFGLFRQHKRHLELRIVVVVHDSDEIFSHWLDIVNVFGLGRPFDSWYLKRTNIGHRVAQARHSCSLPPPLSEFLLALVDDIQRGSF